MIITIMISISICIGFVDGYYISGCKGNIGFAFMVPEIEVDSCSGIPVVTNCTFENIT